MSGVSRPRRSLDFLWTVRYTDALGRRQHYNVRCGTEREALGTVPAYARDTVEAVATSRATVTVEPRSAR